MSNVKSRAKQQRKAEASKFTSLLTFQKLN
jgi:hypothetical protein